MQMQLTKQMISPTARASGESWVTWVYWGSLPTLTLGALGWATWTMSLPWRRSAEQVGPLLSATGPTATFV